MLIIPKWKAEFADQGGGMCKIFYLPTDSALIGNSKEIENLGTKEIKGSHVSKPSLFL